MRWIAFVIVLLAAVPSIYAVAEEAVLSEKEADWAWQTVTPAELEALIARGEVIPTEAEEAETTSFSPLMSARHSNNPDLLDVLVKHGADVNWSDERNGYTALHFAVHEGQIEQARRLLELGADVNRQAINAGPPIFNVLDKGIEDASTRRQLLELLLSYGADLHAEVKRTDKFSVNLLMEVAMNQLRYPDRRESYAGLLDYLVESGIHPDSAPKRNQGGNAMYGVAAEVGGENIIEELVRLGADVNVRLTDGVTPLMFFASYGVSMDAWDALVAHGADIDAMSDRYRSVLYHARDRMKGGTDDGYESSRLEEQFPFSSVEEWRAFGGEIVVRIESLCEERHYQVCDELAGEVNLKAVWWETKEVLLQMLENLLKRDEIH